MRHLLKISLIAGFLLTSAKAMSKDKDFSVSFRESSAKTINLEISNAENISLYLYDDINGEIYADKTGAETYVARSYNLSTLSSGIYYLVAESNQKIEKYKISIEGSKMKLEKTPVSVVTKPEYTIKDNIVTLHIGDLKNSCKVSVSDYSDNIYYQEKKIPVNGELNITFNLNPKTSKSYMVTVEKDGDYFNKLISLE